MTTDRHERTTPGASPSRALPALLLSVAGAELLLNLGRLPVWGSEGRWGCIVRAMLRSGNLFSPRIGTGPYWDKPLLSYWQALPGAALLGDASRFAIRLPSALWALALLALTVDLARRWHGARAALFSGLVLAGTWGFVNWGRNAQVEMTNAAVILLVIALLLRAMDDGGTRWLLAAGVAAGLGANMKGLPAIAVPVACVGLLAASRWSAGRLGPWRGVLLATVACLLAFAVIPLWACALDRSWEPLALAWRENVVRALAPFDHTDPWWTYLVRVFDLAAPWSLLLPLAVVHAVRRRGGPRDEPQPPASGRDGTLPRELVLGAGVLLVFTLSGSRRSYYLLPILPFVAILVGRLLDDVVRGEAGALAHRMLRALGLLLGALFAALLPGLWVWRAVRPETLPEGSDELVPALAALAIVGVVQLVCALRRRWPALVAAQLGVWLVYAALVVPWMADHSVSAQASAALASDPRPCAFLRVDEARLLYELDRSLPVLPDLDAAHAWAQAQQGLVIARSDEPVDAARWTVALRGDHWQALSSLPATRPAR